MTLRDLLKPKDIMIGSSVKFEVKKVARPERLDEAINVLLN